MFVCLGIRNGKDEQNWKLRSSGGIIHEQVEVLLILGNEEQREKEVRVRVTETCEMWSWEVERFDALYMQLSAKTERNVPWERDSGLVGTLRRVVQVWNLSCDE